MTNVAAVEGKENLKLTEWELANLHLPPVTTVTLYEGSAPVENLRSRITIMLEKNPWLTSRIVKKDTADGIVAMAYSKPATDADEPLFKVAVVPIEAEETDDNQATPLQQAITLPGFALVVSMNHTLGDGHTYYKLYGMLSADTDVEVLDPVRVADFEEAKTEVIGREENAMFTSTGLGLGIIGTYIGAKVTRRKPQNVCIHSVDPSWAAHEKAKAKQAGQVPFVSTNDALTSWFFREMKSDLNIMVANFRSRKPSILGLEERHVGNYEANTPYFPGDVETPALIRQSIRSADGGFRARRAGSPPTKIPKFLTLVRNKSAIITNWATFYRDVALQGNTPDNETYPCNPKLHLPIMEPDGLITSVWNNGIIFRPRPGELGMLIITRRFDSDMLTKQKAQDGPNVPMGARIV